MGIFYAKEDTRCPKQILQLVNLAFKHSLAMRTILTPPKTMTICKFMVSINTVLCIMLLLCTGWCVFRLLMLGYLRDFLTEL